MACDAILRAIEQSTSGSNVGEVLPRRLLGQAVTPGGGSGQRPCGSAASGPNHH
jgi:hypothetical protein